MISFSFTYDLLSFDDGQEQLTIVINYSSVISLDVNVVLSHKLTRARHRHIAFVFP